MNERPIELRLWRQFVAVAQELHFGRAARRLNMTQPPLTQAIAQLEAVLGVRLFERTKRSVRLTAAAEALLPRAQDLLARAQELPRAARAAADGQVGRVRLAFVSTVGYTLLPQWVRVFRALQPKVQLELVEATGDQQIEALARGEIDAGFILHSPGFAPPGLEQLLVAREPLVLALPSQHRLAARARGVAVNEMLDQPLVIFPRRIAPSLHDAIFSQYHAGGAVPLVVQEAIQMQTIVNLVSAGLGIAWVPASVRQFQRSGVSYRSLRGAGKSGAVGVGKSHRPPDCETSLVWMAGQLSPALQRFVAFATQQLGRCTDVASA